MIKGDIKQLVVLNEIRSKIEMLKSDIVPESLKVSVVDATQNVASNIKVRDGGYGAAYTTRPLVPVSGSVLDFSQSYLYDSFYFRFSIYMCSNTYSDIYMMFGPVTSASIYKFLFFMINNNNIWSTVYNRTEARIAELADPSSDVNYSQEFANIDKLIDNKHSPMKIIKIPATVTLDEDNVPTKSITYTDGSLDTFYKRLEYSIRFDVMTDLNKLCVPFSNIDYTCYNYGALSVRTDFTNIHESMFYFVLPTSSSLQFCKSGTEATNTANITFGTQNGNGILTLNPVQWTRGDVMKKYDKTAVLNVNDNLIQWIPVAIPIQLSVNAATAQKALITTTNTIGTSSGLKIDGGKVKEDTAATDFSMSKYMSIPIVFNLGNSKSVYEFELIQSQIVQITFDIEETSKKAMMEYFGTMGKVVLPIQTFVTSELNNGTVGPSSNKRPPESIIANISGNNISHVIVTLAPNDSPGCFINSFPQNYIAYINGVAMVQIPYPKINNRVIKDYTNACCDTDTEEINTDFMYSLQFPPEIVIDGQEPRGDNNYFVKKDFETMKTINWDSTMNKFFKNPNGFMHVFQLQVPSAYHTGYSIVELSPVESTFKFTGGYGTTYLEMSDITENRYVCESFTSDATENAQKYRLYSSKNLTLPSYVNRECTFRVTALCDAMIYLDYDPGIDSCTGGGLSYAAPYIPA